MTELQKTKIDSLNEAQLRVTISANFNNKELVAYCEKRLDSLNTDNALAENGEIKVGEV